MEVNNLAGDNSNHSIMEFNKFAQFDTHHTLSRKLSYT